MFQIVSSIKRISAFAVAILVTLLAFPALAGQASLAWNASSSTTVTGYKVHYGTASGSYSTRVDVGNTLSATVPNLTSGTKYYFAVTAYNSAGESGYSNEATATIPAAVAPPVASFTASPATGTAPVNASFVSTSTGSITSYAWAFGDGSTATTAVGNTAHTYTKAGTYTVSLTVTGAGGSNTTTRTVVASAPVLSADFAATPTSGTAPLATTFTATASPGLTTFAWDLGDGTKISGAKVSHTYAAAGNYTVSMTASGTAGTAAPVVKTNYIQTSNALQAAFAANRTKGTAPMLVRFDNQSSGTVNSYSWSFGDGTSGSDPNPVHTYRKPGTYAVTLTVSGPAGKQTSLPTTITVGAANDLVVDYGNGVYMYANGAINSTLLTSVPAKSMAAVDIDRSGVSRVLVDHGAAGAKAGLWLYKADGSSQQVDARTAVSLTVGDADGNGIDDLIADFGSDGIWLIRDLSVKTRIHTGTAKQMILWDKAHDGTIELFASFAGAGVQMYSFANGSWSPFDSHTAVWMATADVSRDGRDDLILDFGPGPGTPESAPAHGIWALVDGASTWKQLDVNSGVRGIKVDMDQYSCDDLVIDFDNGTVKSGLWAYYNCSGWARLTKYTSKSLVVSDLNSDGRQNAVADLGPTMGVWQWQAGSTWARIDTRTAKSIAAGHFK